MYKYDKTIQSSDSCVANIKFSENVTFFRHDSWHFFVLVRNGPNTTHERRAKPTNDGHGWVTCDKHAYYESVDNKKLLVKNIVNQVYMWYV